MLGNSLFDILNEIIDKSPITAMEIAEITGRDPDTVREGIRELETHGNITTTRGGNNQWIAKPSGGELTEAFSELKMQSQHVDWEELLRPALLRVVWYLDEPRTLAEIGNALDVGYSSVRTALDPIWGRAMLSPDGPEYALDDGVSKLWDVADAFIKHRHRQQMPSSNTVLDWWSPTEVVVSVRQEDGLQAFVESDWEKTGLEAFSEYGLTFHSPVTRFHHSTTGELSVEDVACHALLGTPGPREISYTTLLLEHTEADLDVFEECARKCGVEENAQPVIAWLSGDRESASVLSERRYNSLKQQYGVA